ncbi:TIGR02270 family protein [Archangium sp.]|uniref:TIGR02270 family protein n=1 Tax=Archangium sp. TaxID=1872627 RepID=UPI002D43712A|nr:TIGR02270 family protein [Archangium sp.]HYO56872.1 TIGR02270 family protein [Archangium sp.]
MPLPPLEPLPGIVSQHYEEAAFLWTQRRRAIHAPHYTLVDLERLDERMEAHLDGLRIAGPAAWARAEETLADEEPGEAFAATVLALCDSLPTRLAPVLELAQASERCAQELVSALGWSPLPQVAPILEELQRRQEPTLRRVGLAALAVHRGEVGKALAQALSGEEPQLRTRALRAVGELGRLELLPLARPFLSSKDERCRLAAAWTCALLGESVALPHLRALAEAGGPGSTVAVDMAVRRMERHAARSWLIALAEKSEHRRLILQGCAALGDIYFIPWVLERMEEPRLARVAGEAFRFLTGADLSEPPFAGECPEGFEDEEDESLRLDADDDLPWPAPAAVHAWWAQHRQDFHPEARYLLGRPVTPETLLEALRHGRQRERKAAALEWALRRPGKPLFEVRAPGFRQRRLLASMG